MVSTMRYIFLCSLLLLISCGKNEFYLQFDLSHDITENYNVTYYATDVKGGITVQAVASIRDGNCILNGVTKKPTLVFVTQRKSNFPLVIYAERSKKIEISGQDRNPLEWQVKGNYINDELSAWRKDNFDFLINEPDSVNMAVGRFVVANPDNPVSAILMLCYYDRSKNENEYSELMASLKGEAKNSEWLKLLGRSDQMYHSYSYPARLKSMVMRSAEENLDTLIIDKKNPVFIFFWQTGDSDRKEMIDSIKSLAKEFPDSSLLLADICLDVDSVGWKSAMRKDSLEHVKRFWAPTAFLDPTVLKLKVETIPYYMVFDKEGYQSYRGKNLSEAMKEYRRLHILKDSL